MNGAAVCYHSVASAAAAAAAAGVIPHDLTQESTVNLKGCNILYLHHVRCSEIFLFVFAKRVYFKLVTIL